MSRWYPTDNERAGREDYERHGREDYQRERYRYEDREYFNGFDEAKREEERYQERRLEERMEEERECERQEEARYRQQQEEEHYFEQQQQEPPEQETPMPEPCTLKEAEEIVDTYNRYEDTSCSCHMGHPPCSKCVDCPSKEEYLEACKIMDAEDKDA